MIDIKEISQAWWDSYFANNETKQLAKDRFEVCKECPSLTQMFKKIKKVNVAACGECGCPISKKIFSPNFDACPLGKWKNVDSKNINVWKKNYTI